MDAQRRQFRAAIIGTGGIAHAHAQALVDLGSRVRIVAVADVDRSRAEAFAERFGAAAVHDSAESMLALEEINLVHICTPPQTHAPLALAAQRAGVPALVEKPTAMSLDEIDALLSAEAQTGVPVLTVFQHRYGRSAQRLAALAASGALGRPQVATCDTLWFRDDEYFAVPWRGSWEIEGGGPTMGHGIHQFDLLLSVLGPWSTVSALAARRSRPTDTEDVSVAVASFENGALATVVNSVVSPRETSALRFDFEYATVEVEHLYGYRDRDWRFTPATGHEHLAELWAAPADETVSGHALQITAVIDALEAGEQPGVGLAEARRTLEFAAATYASAFRGAPISAGELAGDDPFVRSMSGGIVPWLVHDDAVA